MAKDKKINLLFDATVLSAQRRSGIYNVAYELLQKFQKDDAVSYTHLTLPTTPYV